MGLINCGGKVKEPPRFINFGLVWVSTHQQLDDGTSFFTAVFSLEVFSTESVFFFHPSLFFYAEMAWLSLNHPHLPLSLIFSLNRVFPLLPVFTVYSSLSGGFEFPSMFRPAGSWKFEVSLLCNYLTWQNGELFNSFVDRQYRVCHAWGDLWCCQCCSKCLNQMHVTKCLSSQKANPRHCRHPAMSWRSMVAASGSHSPFLDFLPSSCWFTDAHLKHKPLLQMNFFFFWGQNLRNCQNVTCIFY